jgi:hypothetical protein
MVARDLGVGVAPEARGVAPRPRAREAAPDAGVLHRVVAVHVEIALGLDREVQQRVPGQRLEHVVEEADAGAHAGFAPAVQHHDDVEVGLLGGAADLTDT